MEFFNNETELYAKIQQLKVEIKAEKILEDGWRTSCMHGWYITQKDFRGKYIEYDYVSSKLIQFVDCNGLVAYCAMATIRRNRGKYEYSILLNKNS